MNSDYMTELDALKRDEFGSNELDPRTFVVFSRFFRPGARRKFIEVVKGVGTARLACVKWNLEHGDGERCGLAAEFTALENWEGPIK